MVRAEQTDPKGGIMYEKSYFQKAFSWRGFETVAGGPVP